MRDLAGPMEKPRSGGPARQIVLLLHGYGSSGDDLLSLAPYWAPSLPDALFLAPHAPFPCEINPAGYQWFGLADRQPQQMRPGLEAAAAILDRFIDETLDAQGLDDQALALAGFSQGAMMALHVGLRRGLAPAALLGYSGALLAPELLADQIRARPPVLLVHGMADPVVDFAAMGAAENALKAAGVPVSCTARPGLGHGIDPAGIALGGTFLGRHLGAAASPAAS